SSSRLVKGAHWIEGQPEHIEEANKRSLRYVQLLHQMHDLVAHLGGVQQLAEPPGGAQSGKSANVADSPISSRTKPFWCCREHGAWRRRNAHGRAESGAA